MDDRIAAFFACSPIAVVGASNDRSKFGNIILRHYVRHGRRVFPVHPTEKQVEGLAAYANLAALPERVEAVSIITPPPVTERIVEQAAAAGVKHVWMQPGAESAKAISRAQELGMSVIAGGPCVLVELR